MTMNCYFLSVLNLFIVAVCRPSGDKLASNIGRENDGYDESRQNSLHTIFFLLRPLCCYEFCLEITSTTHCPRSSVSVGLNFGISPKTFTIYDNGDFKGYSCVFKCSFRVDNFNDHLV